MRKEFVVSTILVLPVVISSCAGESDNTGVAGLVNPVCDGSYTISWNWDNPNGDNPNGDNPNGDNPNGDNLSGFRIYYGTTPNLSKYTASGYVDVGQVFSFSFSPGLADCSNAYAAVTALGVQPESAFSNIIRFPQ